MRSGGIVGWLTLIAAGAIIGDLVTHPAGTAAGLNGLNGILKTSFSAALGGKKVKG
jgi:hypothetical protein